MTMMRVLLAGTSLAVMLGSQAVAQTATAPMTSTSDASTTSVEPATAPSEPAAPPAGADSGNSATEASPDIVVTALKRSGSLQKTPATIQVIEPQAVTTAQVAELTNVGRLVPSMQIYTSPLGNPALYLYGMGTSASGGTFEQSVMPFFNGVPNGHARSLVIGLYDLSGIEVVKGTQSILGKNASLGAVLVNTQLPQNELAATVVGRYEFNLDSPYVEGMINVPLSDTLAVRLAGQWRRDGGWVRNVFLDRDEPTTRSWSGRGAVRWRPTADVDISLVYQHDDRRQRGYAFESVGFVPGVGGNGQLLCQLAGIT